MDTLITIAKVIGSFLLVTSFIVGLSKASPRMHNLEHGPMAEYGAGFIMTFASLYGLYYLWF